MVFRVAALRLCSAARIEVKDNILSMSMSEIVGQWHSLWLLDNRAELVHPTGQRLSHVHAHDAPRLLNATEREDHIVVQWEYDISSTFKKSFLSRWSSRRIALPVQQAVKNITMMNYFQLMTSDVELATFLDIVHRDGIVIVTDAPTNTAIVKKVADKMGGTMPTLYGDQFSVVSSVSDGPRKNIAYTNLNLPLHQDLAYYESIPGIQILHALKTSDVGGDSRFLDVFHVVGKFREEQPEHFEVLRRIPATFVKDDMMREKPAQYVYRTPHIHVNPISQDVDKVVWSPPFEGPVILEDPNDAVKYYAAREALSKAIEESDDILTKHLNAGDIVVWNNIRMLHGRTAFEEGSERHLEGTYVNIDIFLNQLRVYHRIVHKEPLHQVYHLGNKCW